MSGAGGQMSGDRGKNAEVGSQASIRFYRGWKRLPQQIQNHFHMKPSNSTHKLAGILEKAKREEILTREEIAFLLHLKQRSQINDLFQTAGANVITSLVPPGFGLAGVAQSSLDIAEARRTSASIRLELEKLGMRAASTDNYLDWIKNRRRIIMGDPSKEKSAC